MDGFGGESLIVEGDTGALLIMETIVSNGQIGLDARNLFARVEFAKKETSFRPIDVAVGIGTFAYIADGAQFIIHKLSYTVLFVLQTMGVGNSGHAKFAFTIAPSNMRIEGESAVSGNVITC